MPPTVFVVDDDDDLRESLIALLWALGHSAMAFASSEEFLSYYDDQPGCLVLDIQMPGQNGIELYEELLLKGKRIPVIFITAHATISTAVAALRTGAIDFLEKPFERQILADRIDRALQADANWRASEARYRSLDQAIRDLNANDRETLEMVIRGETNKAMAAKLLITERAIELRRQRLMKRLNVRTVPELLELTVTHRVLAEVRNLNQQRPFPGS
ncbi:response regulator transcription factor [Planctomicrobium piriforme]|uniref:Two-component response regulator, FixJ family, consists of REC and HTH domains n=1 Tax=Planctomicrobium piriforme TaxID=1576369 RepID=A0A1I3QG09_9PLAN|nr:response regulator [Planctomicrobium piriforme]SFJ32710.1 Two-component response regulator, FixJ family, consists of REC and HTH domains [Planctomicrobium piriforme]